MKVLDIAPQGSKRQAITAQLSQDGHLVVAATGRREALALLKTQVFHLALLDANSDLYQTGNFVNELCEDGSNLPLVAVFVEPNNRPPRSQVTKGVSNVILLQEGTVKHMRRVINLAMSVREINCVGVNRS